MRQRRQIIVCWYLNAVEVTQTDDRNRSNEGRCSLPVLSIPWGEICLLHHRRESSACNSLYRCWRCPIGRHHRITPAVRRADLLPWMERTEWPGRVRRGRPEGRAALNHACWRNSPSLLARSLVATAAEGISPTLASSSLATMIMAPGKTPS